MARVDEVPLKVEEREEAAEDGEPRRAGDPNQQRRPRQQAAPAARASGATAPDRTVRHVLNPFLNLHVLNGGIRA